MEASQFTKEILLMVRDVLVRAVEDDDFKRDLRLAPLHRNGESAYELAYKGMSGVILTVMAEPATFNNSTILKFDLLWGARTGAQTEGHPAPGGAHFVCGSSLESIYVAAREHLIAIATYDEGFERMTGMDAEGALQAFPFHSTTPRPTSIPWNTHLRT